MSYKGRGWNETEIEEAGCTEDGEPLPYEVIPEEEFMAWRERGKKIMTDEKERQWQLGCWVCEGEDMKEQAGEGGIDQRFRNSIYKAAAAITGHSINTLKAMANVVRNVPEEIKEEFPVSFAHLKLVANRSYSDEQRRDYLAQIHRSNLNVTEARERIAFLTGQRTEKMSKERKRAKRFAYHASGLIDLLENGTGELDRKLLQRLKNAIEWELQAE